MYFSNPPAVFNKNIDKFQKYVKLKMFGFNKKRHIKVMFLIKQSKYLKNVR